MSDLLIAGLIGAFLTVGVAIGLADLLDKLTHGTVRPRLVFSNHNDDKNVDGLQDHIKILQEDNQNLCDEIDRLVEENQGLKDDVEYLQGKLVAARRANRDPSVSSFNEDSPLAPRSGRRRVESPSPRRRHHVDGDIGARYRPTPTPTRTSTRSRAYTTPAVDPSTPLSEGFRTASKSPARTPGEGPITKKEKLDAGAQRAAEWARKRKEKKAS